MFHLEFDRIMCGRRRRNHWELGIIKRDQISKFNMAKRIIPWHFPTLHYSGCFLVNVFRLPPRVHPKFQRVVDKSQLVKFHIEHRSYKMFQIISTFLLINFALTSAFSVGKAPLSSSLKIIRSLSSTSLFAIWDLNLQRLGKGSR